MQFLFGVWVLSEKYRLFATLVSVVCTPLSASSGFAAFNMTHAVPHVFLLDSGLESIARVVLTRHTAIFMQSEEGFHRIFRGWLVLSTMMVQVVCHGIFWEIPSGNVPVFSATWFDNGYMFASAHEVLSDKGVDMPVVMLEVVDVPVVVQRQGYGQTVQNAVLVPQLLFIEGRWPPFVPQRLPHRDSAVAVGQVVDAPVVQVVPCPLSCDRCSWFRHCRKLWRCRRCSKFAVVDVAVISQRQVPGKAGRCLRPVHRQDVQVLRRSNFAAFCGIFRTPSVWT